MRQNLLFTLLSHGFLLVAGILILFALVGGLEVDRGVSYSSVHSKSVDSK